MLISYLCISYIPVFSMNLLKIKPLYIVTTAVILNIIIHLPFINLGPRSKHAWRQTNTLAVARNFYLEDMNILKPRVDRRLNTDGVTGMQFPSYEFAVASLYKAFGEYNFIHRALSLLISSIGIIAMYLLAKLLVKNELAAAFAAIAYAFSPDLFYFGFTALPDILALMCSVLGLYFFLKWFIHQASLGYYTASLFLLILAGLTKIQFLAVGFLIAPLILQNLKLTKNKISLLLIFALLAVIIPVSWYVYSVQLIKKSGLYDFGITFRPVNDFNLGIKIIIKNLVSDLPEILLNYASFILFLVAIYFFIKNKFWHSKWFYPMLVWSISLLAYHIIELNQMREHTYYMMPYLPLLFIMIAYAVREIQVYEFSKKILVVLLLVEPINASARILPSRFLSDDPGIPLELYSDVSRNKLVASIPNYQRCIVGPDISGCIYFYHLRQKGFGFDYSNKLFENYDEKPYIQYCIENGAKYLISNDSTLKNNSALDIYIDKEIITEGNFFIYSLH